MFCKIFSNTIFYLNIKKDVQIKAVLLLEERSLLDLWGMDTTTESAVKVYVQIVIKKFTKRNLKLFEDNEM